LAKDKLRQMLTSESFRRTAWGFSLNKALSLVKAEKTEGKNAHS
jgi:hypothetical protein